MFSPYIVYIVYFTALLLGLKSANCLYVYCVCSLRSSRSGARPSIGCTRICASNCISVYVFVCKYHFPFTCSSASTSYVLYISMSHSIVVYQYSDPFIRSYSAYSGSFWKFLIDLFSYLYSCNIPVTRLSLANMHMVHIVCGIILSMYIYCILRYLYMLVCTHVSLYVFVSIF